MEEKQKEYMTTAEAAELWEVKSETVADYCQKGRIRGATKVGGKWQIPRDAVKPQSKLTIKRILQFIAYLQTDESVDSEYIENDLDKSRLESALKYLSDYGYIEIAGATKLKDCKITYVGVNIISKTVSTDRKRKSDSRKKLYENFKEAIEVISKCVALVSNVIALTGLL